MSNTLLTLRVSEELAKWLSSVSRRTGIPVGRLVREQIERARQEQHEQDEPGFMRYAGSVSGTRDLSSGKGFSR